VGFDLVELCPDPAHHASDFLAAKLYYKMLSYKFNTNEADLDEEAFDFNQKTQEHLPKFKNDDI
ncbi:MAG: agmatinase, partial [Bacteroidetes bacterium]|nr:agmatinase [Bacteroidota bacterium]